MSDPPPSSALPVAESPFFHHPDGQQILVFVEAGGILHRPRLIRNLKKHDAVICTDPKHAQIILVDPESWQGKEFIREWGSDQNKVVLSHTWVTKSINAAKPLLEGDDWGGCKTHDDGLPILRPTVNGGEEIMAPKSPLPTPRETPVEAKVASLKRRRSTDAHRKRASIDKSLPRINTTSAPTENGGTSSPASHLPSHMPSLSHLSQSHIQSTPVLSPTASDSVSLLTQQQAPPAMPFGMSGFNMPMMQFPPQMLAMFAQQQTTAQSPMSTQPPSMMQENFTTALMDIMKMYGTVPGGVPGGMSMGQWPMFPNMMAQMQQQMPQSAGSSGSATVVREDSSGASNSRRATESPSLSLPQGSQSPSVLQPSFKRKRKSDVMEDDSGNEVPETADDSDDDEDGDEPPLAALYKKKKRAEERKSKQKQKDKDTRKARRTSLQFIAPPRNPHQTSKPLSSGDPSQKLFVHLNGKPMQFFVQVDQNNRQEVTRAIKKYGGVITSQIPGADYAVLYTLSTTFKSLLNEAAVTHTPAVTHHFVLDSINEGSIPDNLDNYIFNAKQTPQAKRKHFNNAAEAELKRLEKNAKQSERAKQEMNMKYNYVARSGTPEPRPSISLASTSSSSTGTAKKATSSTPKPSSPKVRDEEKPRPARIVKPKDSGRTSTPVPTVKKPTFLMTRSSTSGPTTALKSRGKKSGYHPKESTPPPPTKTQRFATGYLYTQEERDWTEKYLFILFKRDPHMSQTAVVKALFRKLPHHTSNSWSSFLAGAFRSEYEETRKKGGIAHRKEKNKWETKQEKGEEGQETSDKEDERSNFEKMDQKMSEREEEPEQMEDVVQGREELEKQQERAEEKEIEDQVIQGASSPGKIVEEKGSFSQVFPMQVDETDSVVMEDGGEASGVTQYTQEEEADMQAIVQFFLSGGDDGESDESVIWANLAEKEGRKTAEEWEKVFSRHDKEITNRYGDLLTAKGQVEANKT